MPSDANIQALSAGVVMDEKKVIAKLATIVAKQQRIITKLAQVAGLDPGGKPMPMGGATDANWDVQGEVANVLSQNASAHKVRAGVQSATLGPQSGFLDVKVQFPKGVPMESPDANAALKAVKDAFKVGTQMKGPGGQMVAVKQQNVVGIYG